MKPSIGLLMMLAVAAFPAKARIHESPTVIDHAFDRIYNFDFPAVHAMLEEEARRHPENPLIYSVRSAAYLFSEFHRMNILETEFFEDDDKVTDIRRIKPDPAARAAMFRMIEEARRRAQTRLAVDAYDREALFAVLMAAAVETDYVGVVDKKYFRTYSLSKECQQYARKLLALNPPFTDAYMTLGSVEYVVSSLNFFFRLLVHFDRIEGSKQKAIENLKKVIAGGRYYPPFAKILLSVIYLRDRQPRQALVLLKELERDYPENPLFRKEVLRISQKTARSSRE